MEDRGFISCGQDNGERKINLTQEEFDKLKEINETEQDSLEDNIDTKPEETSNIELPANQHKVKIFGVGGAGCKIVDSLRGNKRVSAEYFFVDDNPNNLADYKNAAQIWVGAESCNDHTYEYGKKAGCEFKKDIDHAVYKADLVVIVAGIGGGMGSGTSVAIAEIAKENKISTVAVVCSPFSFEGKNRNANAKKSLNTLRALGVPTIVVPCENIKSIVPKTTAMRDAIQLEQTMALNALNALLMPIISSSAVNLDFFETVALLKKSNNIYFGYGESKGKERTIEAVRYAVNCPMAESAFENVTGMILYVEGGDDLVFDEVTEVATLVRAATDSSVNIIFASTVNSELTGKIKVSILATKQVYNLFLFLCGVGKGYCRSAFRLIIGKVSVSRLPHSR